MEHKQRPESVTAAVKLLYGAAIGGLFNGIIFFNSYVAAILPKWAINNPGEVATAQRVLVVSIVGCAGLNLFLTHLVSKGYGWARWAFVIAIPLGLLGSAVAALRVPASDIIPYLGPFAMSLVGAGALGCLFREDSSEWFRGDEDPQAFSRKQLLEAFPKILALVQAGKISYSEVLLNRQYNSFKRKKLFMTISSVLFVLSLVILAIVGVSVAKDWVWIVMTAGGLLGLVIHPLNASKFESLARQFLAGSLVSNQHHGQSSSVADEIFKLQQLRQDGSINENEFQRLKSKVI